MGHGSTSSADFDHAIDVVETGSPLAYSLRIGLRRSCAATGGTQGGMANGSSSGVT